VWVDCGAASGGNGHTRAPYARISDAVAAERPAAGAVASHRTIIAVRPGVCAAETFPIRLDYPVWVRGSRVGQFDAVGLPVDGQTEDTLVLGSATVAFFQIAADDVEVSDLSLDGRQSNPPLAGLLIGAIEPTGVRGFDLRHLRIVRATTGIISKAASGRIRGSYLGTLREGLIAFGGTSAAPADIGFTGNRVSDYPGGAVALIPANPAGDDLTAVISGNEFITSYVDSGPSNPFGLRVNGVFGGPPNVHGKLMSSVIENRFLGSHRYAIIVSAGNVLRAGGGVPDAHAYTATLHLSFSGNFISPDQITASTAIITYTNSRATELTCELNPANTGPACPRVQNGRYWKYAQDSVFDLVHEGELDNAWIDHPATDPVDGRVLNNILIMNGRVVPNETFVVVP
jgi:hypothetical protein